MEPRTVTVTTPPGSITLALHKVITQFCSQGARVSPGPLLTQLCKRFARQESEDIFCKLKNFSKYCFLEKNTLCTIIH